MELSEIGVVAGLVLAGFASFYAAFALAARRRRGARAKPAARAPESDPQIQAEAAVAA